MVREWRVAGGLIEGPGGILLVRNRRRWGSHDWSPPGGVIDESDQGVVEGLTREVLEETGIEVTEWLGPVYEVSARAHDMGWHLRAQVFRAHGYRGDLAPDDPDGIVDHAEFVDGARCSERLVDCYPWVREPLAEWIEARWDAAGHRVYRYEIFGSDPRSLRVERLHRA